MHLGIVLKVDERSLQGKPLTTRAMQIWINATGILLSMIVLRTPFPRVVQFDFGGDGGKEASPEV